MMVMCWEIMFFFIILLKYDCSNIKERGHSSLQSAIMEHNHASLRDMQHSLQCSLLSCLTIPLDCIACCIVLRCICQGQSKSWSFLRALNENFLQVKGQSHEDLLEISQCRKSEVDRFLPSFIILIFLVYKSLISAK